ncbi:malto-oligosyltrehalose synthase [Microbacterium sp.]|uniref:malto-oligosyltrehalose synthase n=1 Tax=Microbacterium sp. TaxID=51671 RepID=UPI0025E5392B|nr:malto-oligosyltrehalose synthase [Microbacterium sp.]
MTRRPVSTYRLQLRPSFDLDAAAEALPYLRDLGVDWAYLSPLLQAAAGSEHGYDVVDPTRVDETRGGPAALARFSAAARAAGLGILVDIVPNHQGVAIPAENPWWWDVLLRGRASPHAGAFDIDWEHGDGRLVLPVLGSDPDEVLGAGEMTVSPEPTDDAPFGTARYHTLVLPLAEGTAPLRATADVAAVRDVLARQHWRLVWWRRDVDLLNYRRFFTVTSLAGVRVEVPEVFDASHVEVVRWIDQGVVDGLRIDHPDGLADPGAYLESLAEAVGSAYVVVEKILETGEELPGWWQTDGTTGYDALAEIDRVLTDPAGEAALTALDTRLRGEALAWPALIHDTKRLVADTAQAAEVGRLVRCLPAAVRDRFAAAVLRDALAELLAAFPVYRAYLPAGTEHIRHAADDASRARPELADAIAAMEPLIAEPARCGTQEFSRRFMQTTGPVMAKGVEDSAFYRCTRLGSSTEVGADPSQFALPPADFHAASARRQAAWPHTLTALSTHDTKRSEDVRARLAVLAEIPARWSEVLRSLRAIASAGDGPLDALLWQAVVGAWPASPERLRAYAEKAAREGGIVTTWAEPDHVAESRVRAVVDAAFGAAQGIVEGFAAEIMAAGRSNALAAKLLQLAGPGVPDVYQGTELWDLSLVDPDNRRAVDFAERRRLLARLDDGWMPEIDESGAAKLLVTSRALRLRRDRPELFTRYIPVTVVGEAAEYAIAFDRGGALAVATRLPVGLAARGGWGDTVLLRRAGDCVDVLTGRRYSGGALPMADLLDTYPVALLVADWRAQSVRARIR